MKYIFGNSELLTVDYVKGIKFKPTDELILCNPHEYRQWVDGSVSLDAYKWMRDNVKCKAKYGIIRNIRNQYKDFGHDEYLELLKSFNFDIIYYVIDDEHNFDTEMAQQACPKGVIVKSKYIGYHSVHFPSTGYIASQLFPDALCVGFQSDGQHDGNVFHAFEWEHEQLENRIIKI